MNSLKLMTAQAINTVPVSRAIADYLNQRMCTPVKFVSGSRWQERYRLLDEGQIHMGWVCGLPYVARFDQLDSNIELLAAPVMQAARYQDRPIYFSDVVVHRNSPFRTFSDLQGASWAYNEPNSQSGYNITRYHLAVISKTSGFFGRVVGAGSHRLSLRLILKGKIDASAIDSTVLEWELTHHPEISSQIRVIETLGPSPIPPLVVLKSVPQEIQQQLRHLLLQMEEDATGRAVLAIGHLARFVAVQDRDYDPIRHMARQAAQVVWAANIS